MTDDNTDVRQRILLGARAMFVPEGITAVSLNEICRRLHVAKKTFYLHFDDKDALVAAVVDATLVDYAAAIADATRRVAAADRPREILRAVFSVSATHVSALLLADLKVTSPRLWSRIHRGRKALLQQLLADFARGQRAGRYRNDIDAESLAATVELILDRVLDPSVLADRGLSPHQTASLLVDLFFDGVMVKRS